MKKLRMMAVLAFAFCLALVGCGGATSKPDPKKDFIGSWELAKMASGEVVIDEEMTASAKAEGVCTYLDLNEDGTATFESNEESLSGTWTVKEQWKGTITINGTTVDAALEDGRLVLSHVVDDELYSMTFNSIDPSEKIELVNPYESDDAGTTTYYGGDTIEDLDNAVEMNVDLVDDDLCTIKVIAMGDYVGDPGFLFELTNKTDQDILFMSDNNWTAANGIVDDPVLYETLHAGETLQSIMWFNADVVGGVDPSVLKDIKGTILLLDSTDTSNEIARYSIAF